MQEDRKVVVVLPAYNAARTLRQTYAEIPMDVVDEVVLVDDASHDETVAEARRLGIHHVLVNPVNLGYGGNQKACYRKALELGADIVIMLHPDYQYAPQLIRPMAALVASGLFPVVLGSRILGNGALRGGMPVYKYIANRALTLVQNLCCGQKLSEYHTGYRAFDARVLRDIDMEANSNDFLFDNQVLSQIIYKGYPIGEITCPTRYFDDASSIRLAPSIVYGLGVLRVSVQHLLQRAGLARFGRYR